MAAPIPADVTDPVDLAVDPDADAIPDEPETLCTACGTVLEPEFPDSSTNYQFENALWIGFHGGYGMFTDNAFADDIDKRVLPGGPDHEAVICHDCAHRLCEIVPWIGEIIEPLRSHAHSGLRDWGSHEGWDLPHTKR